MNKTVEPLKLVLLSSNPIRIVTKSGIKIKSNVKITKALNNGVSEYTLNWRQDIGLNVNLIESINTENEVITIYFPPDFELKLEFNSIESILEFQDLLKSIMNRTHDIENISNNNNNSNNDENIGIGSLPIKLNNTQKTLDRQLPIEIAFLSEKACQNITTINFNEGAFILEPFLLRIVKQLLKSKFSKWAQYTKDINQKAMISDRRRWRFHAVCNQDIDLQAWYHAVYYKEVYRPRGLFWYRDAVLPVYRNSYDLVDNTLSPMEEAALAHVLCSPETSYGDVAGQMFIVQSIVKNPSLFSMFQKLSAQGKIQMS